MAFSEKLARLWQNIVLFGRALDHDPQSDMAQEIDRLVAARNGDRVALTAIVSNVDALAAEVHGLSERVEESGRRTMADCGQAAFDGSSIKADV